jgi:drug/metabolite transporter (DMT)-like permease
MQTTALDASAGRPAAWKTLLAFAIIYLVWGSTFLAIRIGVAEVPPFLFAAMRFLAAGLAMYVWLTCRGQRQPSARQWASASILAVLIFVGDYGMVFWAEQRVPSGLTAVMLATIPAFMALSEIFFLRTQKLTRRLAAALLIGMGGVAVLTSRSLNLGGVPVDRAGAVALLIGAVSWSIGSALSRKLALPESKAMSSGVQMLTGGVFLALIALARGEFHGFHPANVSRTVWIALAYLIVAGSLVAFTAYVWLLHHESPTKVGTYAYVNPVVAVVLGYFAAGEPLGLRTVVGTAFVLVSVLVITTTRAPKPAKVATFDVTGDTAAGSRATS